MYQVSSAAELVELPPRDPVEDVRAANELRMWAKNMMDCLINSEASVSKSCYEADRRKLER